MTLDPFPLIVHKADEYRRLLSFQFTPSGPENDVSNRRSWAKPDTVRSNSNELVTPPHGSRRGSHRVLVPPLPSSTVTVAATKSARITCRSPLASARRKMHRCGSPRIGGESL